MTKKNTHNIILKKLSVCRYYSRYSQDGKSKIDFGKRLRPAGDSNRHATRRNIHMYMHIHCTVHVQCTVYYTVARWLLWINRQHPPSETVQ